jgi:hypothetical protein
MELQLNFQSWISFGNVNCVDGNLLEYAKRYEFMTLTFILVYSFSRTNRDEIDYRGLTNTKSLQLVTRKIGQIAPKSSDQETDA